VDLRAERAQGCLAVHAVHEEAAGLDEAAQAALADNLRQLADWLGLVDIRIACPSRVAQRLRVLLG
ncbi:MAG TPA: winged helix-turn-helix domain-containing protein, partial [Pseudomonas sp.]|nr:winged helix-turn-helix domain-containing protein [Pseudomonas sp.]